MSAAQRAHEHPAARPSGKTRAERRPPDGDEPAQAQHAAARPRALCGATRSPPPRTALTIKEACESLGVSWDLFHERIEPELRVVRTGRRKLIPVSELLAWLDRNAEKML
jgi:excisionase family DNA binding protein